MLLCPVCEQQWRGSGVSAACRALQHLCGGGFLPRIQEIDSPGRVSGRLVWEKDPCCVRVCRWLWIHFQCWRRSRRRCRRWKGVATFITSPVYTVSMTNPLKHTHWVSTRKMKFDIVSVGGLNTTCWLTLHWECNMSTMGSRHMICLWQRLVSDISSRLILPRLTLSCLFSSSLTSCRLPSPLVFSPLHSSHVVSCYLISSTDSSHLLSCRLLSSRLISLLLSSRLVPSRLISSCLVSL